MPKRPPGATPRPGSPAVIKEHVASALPVAGPEHAASGPPSAEAGSTMTNGAHGATNGRAGGRRRGAETRR